jgi:hypothetical protein
MTDAYGFLPELRIAVDAGPGAVEALFLDADDADVAEFWSTFTLSLPRQSAAAVQDLYLAGSVVKATVALRCCDDLNALLWAAATGDPDLRWAAIARDSAPVPLLAAVATTGTDDAAASAQRRLTAWFRTPADAVLADPNLLAACEMARATAATGELLVLAGHTHSAVRRTLAMRADLPTVVLERLAGDIDWDVLTLVADREVLPASVRAEFDQLAITALGYPSEFADVICRTDGYSVAAIVAASRYASATGAFVAHTRLLGPGVTTQTPGTAASSAQDPS